VDWENCTRPEGYELYNRYTITDGNNSVEHSGVIGSHYTFNNIESSYTGEYITMSYPYNDAKMHKVLKNNGFDHYMSYCTLSEGVDTMGYTGIGDYGLHISGDAKFIMTGMKYSRNNTQQDIKKLGKVIIWKHVPEKETYELHQVIDEEYMRTNVPGFQEEKFGDRTVMTSDGNYILFGCDNSTPHSHHAPSQYPVGSSYVFKGTLFVFKQDPSSEMYAFYQDLSSECDNNLQPRSFAISGDGSTLAIVSDYAKYTHNNGWPYWLYMNI
jgi:hypothetical protein